jgi:hypothetical protein
MNVLRKVVGGECEAMSGRNYATGEIWVPLSLCPQEGVSIVLQILH